MRATFGGFKATRQLLPRYAFAGIVMERTTPRETKGPGNLVDARNVFRLEALVIQGSLLPLKRRPRI